MLGTPRNTDLAFGPKDESEEQLTAITIRAESLLWPGSKDGDEPSLGELLADHQWADGRRSAGCHCAHERRARPRGAATPFEL